jgi:hypothetical protein
MPTSSLLFRFKTKEIPTPNHIVSRYIQLATSNIDHMEYYIQHLQFHKTTKADATPSYYSFIQGQKMGFFSNIIYFYLIFKNNTPSSRLVTHGLGDRC